MDCIVVVFNNRGLGGLMLKILCICCVVDIEDLEFVIFYIKKVWLNFLFMVVGIFFGGLILINFLCKMGE